MPEVFEAGVLLTKKYQKLTTEDELQLLGDYFDRTLGE